MKSEAKNEPEKMAQHTSGEQLLGLSNESESKPDYRSIEAYKKDNDFIICQIKKGKEVRYALAIGKQVMMQPEEMKKTKRSLLRWARKNKIKLIERKYSLIIRELLKKTGENER